MGSEMCIRDRCWVCLGLVEVDLVCCTVSDCVFLPMPIQYSQLTAKDPFHLVLLFFIFLSSIIMPWFTVFFFEFKYLASEVSQYQSINWRSWKAWIWPRGLKRKCAEHLHPINSEDAAESRALL